MTLQLADLQSPMQLHELSNAELTELAGEIRERLCQLLAKRPAHFASNLEWSNSVSHCIRSMTFGVTG